MNTRVCVGGAVAEASSAAGGWGWSEHPAHHGCLVTKQRHVNQLRQQGGWSLKGRQGK